MLGVRKRVRAFYFQKCFFLEFNLWIRRILFWQLCWELSGKSLNISLSNSKKDFNYVFYEKFVPSGISSRHSHAEILRFFPWKSESVEFFFSEPFFGKMLVWTGRMQLWWHLRHFSPKSWKSSAQSHKLMEKNDFNLKIFFLRKSPVDT